MTVRGRLVVERLTPAIFSELMGAVQLNVLTSRAYADLREALGGDECAILFLIEEATKHDKPIALNVPIGKASITTFLGPRHWTHARLTGWAATYRDDLAQAFGAVSGPIRRVS